MPTVNNWKTLAFRVRFLTPAFLGDAEQKGRWRTPPFKALLRQWWRVAYAAQEGYRGDIARMREVEGKLFGNAWLEKQSGKAKEADFCKSLVRLRLSRWEAGRLTSWPSTAPQEQIFHPELTEPADPYLYLGYGPLHAKKGLARSPAMQGGSRTSGSTCNDRKGLARSPAIAPGEQTTLALAFPAENAELIEAAVALMHLYGTVGGRSRNGWGSFVIEGPGERRWDGLSRLPIRTWKEALVLDWPHAIGKDDTGPLIWQTGEYDNWREVMRALAIVRLGVRTQFVFSSAPPHPAPQPRHWLSYPIKRHNCESWNNQLRLPNSLRFKVRPSPQNPDRLVGIIFHIPCLPPPNFRPQRTDIMGTWQTVHKLLDQMSNRPSQRKYDSIEDPDRRKKLKPWLDKVHLKRIER